MALPKQIEKQAEEAEVVRKRIYESQASPSEEEQPVSSDPDAEQPPKPADDQPQVVQPSEPAAQPPAPAPAPEHVEDGVYWKKRFETIQGKFDAEMPRLYSQLREQGELIKDLSKRLEKAPDPQPTADAPLVTQQEVDAFGDDLIDVVRRVAREEIRKFYTTEQKALTEKVSAVETRVGDVANVVRQSAIDSFWGEVTKLVPDWIDVDKDPRWIAWLDTSPEFTTSTYRTLATQAINVGDFRKIAKLVDVWKREMGNPRSPAPAQSALPVPPAPRHSSELERQVEPSTVRSSASPSPQNFVTREQYEALYDVRNVTRFGPQRAQEMIAEADRAVAEGRVRW